MVRREKRGGSSHRLAVLGMALLMTGCNWPMFGFDPIHSGSNPQQTAISPQDVGTLAQMGVTTAMNGPVTASPTTANGILYETADLGTDLVGTLYAYSATGRTRCTRGFPKTCRPLWTETPGGTHHQLITSPAVDTANNVVYVGSANGILYAYDATSGALDWQSPPMGGSVGSSPTIAGGFLYVSIVYQWTYVFPLTTGSDGANPSCFTKATGQRVCRPGWGYFTPGDVYSSPAVAGGILYSNAGSPTDTLYAYDALADGYCDGAPYSVPLGASCDDPLWTAATGGGKSSPSVADGIVYLGSLNSGLLAFSADGSRNCSGTPYTYLRGMTCTPLWSAATGRQNGSSPAVADGVVYIGARNGYLYAFDATNGSLVWEQPTGGVVDSAPAISNGVVYVGCSNLLESAGQTCLANLSAFDETDGDLLWSGTTDGTNGTVDSSPIVVDAGPSRDVGAVFVGSSSGPSECVGSSACSSRVFGFALRTG